MKNLTHTEAFCLLEVGQFTIFMANVRFDCNLVC